MSSVDVVGEFGDRWHLAFHDAAYVTGNQNAAVNALIHDMANGPWSICQQHLPDHRPRKAVQDGCKLAAPPRLRDFILSK